MGNNNSPSPSTVTNSGCDFCVRRVWMVELWFVHPAAQMDQPKKPIMSEFRMYTRRTDETNSAWHLDWEWYAGIQVPSASIKLTATIEFEILLPCRLACLGTRQVHSYRYSRIGLPFCPKTVYRACKFGCKCLIISADMLSDSSVHTHTHTKHVCSESERLHTRTRPQWSRSV